MKVKGVDIRQKLMKSGLRLVDTMWLLKQLSFTNYETYSPDTDVLYRYIFNLLSDYDVQIDFNKEDKLQKQALVNVVKKKYPFLYDFQAQAIASALFYVIHSKVKGAALFWDVGCGKTVSSGCLADFVHSVAVRGGRPIKGIIILSPLSLFRQWRDELIKFRLAEPYEVKMLNEGKAIHKLRSLASGMYKWYILTYETWRNIADKIENDKYIYVLDEASKIKNPTARVTKQALKNLPKSIYTILLTATPIETSPMNYYNLLYVVDRRWMGYPLDVAKELNRKTFRSQMSELNKLFKYTFVEEITFTVKDVKGNERKISKPIKLRNKELLTAITSYVCDVKRKKDVKKDLPPITIQDVPIEQPIEVVKEYGRLVYYLEDITTGEAARKRAADVLSTYVLAHILVNHPQAYLMSDSTVMNDVFGPGGFEHIVDEKTPCKKAEWVVDFLSDFDFNHQQVLIFTQYERVAFLLDKYIKKKLPEINGVAISASVNKRDDYISQFKEGKIGYMIATQCLARGISFDKVNYLINYDYHPNPAIMEQRIGRICRINSKEPKTIYNLYSTLLEEQLKKVSKTRGMEAEKMLTLLKQAGEVR